jgi:hypothetical protein
MVRADFQTRCLSVRHLSARDTLQALLSQVMRGCSIRFSDVFQCFLRTNEMRIVIMPSLFSALQRSIFQGLPAALVNNVAALHPSPLQATCSISIISISI